MSAEVILVNPSYVYPPLPATDVIKDDPLVMDLPSLEFMYPPIGILAISGTLKKHGFSVECIDSNVAGLTMEQLARRCEGAKVVGISLLVANLRATYQLIQVMKGRGYEIVVGGAHPSVEPEVVPKLGIRYGISGEGEESFTSLCKALIRGEGKPEDIPGIIIAETDHPDDFRVYTKHPELLENLADYLPDRECLRSPNYKLPFVGSIEVALGSRGCPYKCPFCYCSSASPNSMFNASRYVPADVLVKDIKQTITQYRPNYLEMIDETFTVNRQWVVDICQGIIDEGIEFTWGAKTRVDLMDPDLLDLMHRAGMRKIGFGLESGVFDLRKDMTKDFTNAKVKQIFSAANRIGVEPACTIVFGHPNETREDMKESVEFVKSIQAAYVEFHIMILIPKTKNFYLAVEEGKATEDTFDKFMRGEIGYPEYAPGDITHEEMRRIRHDAVRSFYFRPAYIAQQARRSLKRPQELLQYAKTAKSLWDLSKQKKPIWGEGRAAS
ncbi:MAG: B12-binding domain-containing radical SAM protein [Proteobacteria bacterium]|nr:B12-binding domain-containing radical SAM protein [Pseudomonadota bacterium]